MARETPAGIVAAVNDGAYDVLTNNGDPASYQPGQTFYSEMAQLFHLSWGNKAYCPAGDPSCTGGPQPGWGLTDPGDFQNMQTALCWSGSRGGVEAAAPSSVGILRTSARDGLGAG